MSELRNKVELTDRTIADFGDQWRRYQDNDGFYGSVNILAETFGPLLPLSALKGLRVGEIGSGTGRIVSMLLEAGADHVVAIEPSEAFEVLKENVARWRDRVTLLNVRGDQLPDDLDLDLVVSIGVIHHIPEPASVMQAAYDSLKLGGRCLIWVYGAEGNGKVVSLIRAMRSVTTRLPHWAVSAIAQACTVALDLYSGVVRKAPFDLPMKQYIESVIGKFPRDKRYLVIYDQLRPAYAKYYQKNEVVALLDEAGFRAIESYHRKHYSWSAIGTK